MGFSDNNGSTAESTRPEDVHATTVGKPVWVQENIWKCSCEFPNRAKDAVCTECGVPQPPKGQVEEAKERTETVGEKVWCQPKEERSEEAREEASCCDWLVSVPSYVNDDNALVIEINQIRGAIESGGEILPAVLKNAGVTEAAWEKFVIDFSMDLQPLATLSKITKCLTYSLWPVLPILLVIWAMSDGAPFLGSLFFGICGTVFLLASPLSPLVWVAFIVHRTMNCNMDAKLQHRLVELETACGVKVEARITTERAQLMTEGSELASGSSNQRITVVTKPCRIDFLSIQGPTSAVPASSA
jgi:hypothetical protein